MYFFEGDPVSMHTLTAAGYNVIRDVNKKRGGSKMLVKEQILDMVRPEMREEFHKQLHAAENFFKHADRDHDETFDFSPSQTELLVYDACTKYAQLTGEQPPLFQLFRAWYMCHNTEMLMLPDATKKLIAKHRNLISGGKSSFFNTMLPQVMELGVAQR